MSLSKVAQGSQPQVQLTDPSDRARSYRVPGVVRIPLSQLGFYAHNRGGLGVDPFHVSEIASDCNSNRVNLSRYAEAAVAIVPVANGLSARLQINDTHLHALVPANQLKCKNDPLMPPHSIASRIPQGHYCAFSLLANAKCVLVNRQYFNISESSRANGARRVRSFSNQISQSVVFVIW